jgi:hypothetical protein
MKNIKYMMTFLLMALIFGSCSEENYELGGLDTPSNLTVTSEIVGTDADNLYGDGSGTVNFTATATDAITYKFIYNGAETVSASGTKTYTFSTTGTNDYSVTVIAYGSGGVSTSTTVDVTVLVTYTAPADLVTMLTSDSSRTWRIEAETAGHFGVGPADSDTSSYWSAGAYDKIDKGAYDDTFTFNVDGTFTHTTNDTAYGQSGPMTTDFGDQGQTANSDGEFENFPLANYTVNYTISEPDGEETISFSGFGYHGFYVGGDHTYTIISRTDNTMYLRTVGSDGLGWFVKFIADE